MSEDACCKTCEQWAGKEAPAIERDPLDGKRFEVIVEGRGDTRVFTPTKSHFVFGRAADCDARIDDGAVSRHQTRLVFEDDAVYVEDLRSTCGTYLDGRQVQRAQVGKGAVIEFANVTVRVVER